MNSAHFREDNRIFSDLVVNNHQGTPVAEVGFNFC